MLSSTVSTGQRHIADFIFVLYFYMVSFDPSYVGYIYSLGSIVVPKHKPTSGSGDPSSTLGEEVCAPLWFKTSVLLAFLNSQQCNTVLVNVATKSLVSPQLDLATIAHHQGVFVSKDDGMYSISEFYQHQVNVSHYLVMAFKYGLPIAPVQTSVAKTLTLICLFFV